MIVDEILFDKARQIVNQNKNFSPSFLQRKLAIGYNKSCLLIDMIKESYVLRLELQKKQRVRFFAKHGKKFRYV